jgi:urease accessory protein
MIRAISVTDHCHDPIASITLDETARHRRRMAMTSDRMANGSTIQFLLDLPQAVLLRHGNGLQLEDGSVIEVRAKPETLYEITAESPARLLVLAWHIGNRHLAADICENTIRIRPDHVIKAMLEGLGATVIEIEEPFNPEGGAYGGHHDHGHEH